MTKYTVKYSSQFKKDYKLALKRSMKIELLNKVITDLANGVALSELRLSKYSIYGMGSNPFECSPEEPELNGRMGKILHLMNYMNAA